MDICVKKTKVYYQINFKDYSLTINKLEEKFVIVLFFGIDLTIFSIILSRGCYADARGPVWQRTLKNLRTLKKIFKVR